MNIDIKKNIKLKSYNILSLDGGGVRGISEIVLLKRLEKEYSKFIRDTDLLVGTSSGGIIALALAADFSLTEIQELFSHSSKNIFMGSLFNKTKNIDKLITANYNTEGIRNSLREFFGDMKLGDLNKKVAIVSFDLDNNALNSNRRTWKPKIFHNFPGQDSDEDVDVVDACLYTAAAPTFFPSVDGYIDGGVIANNPAMVGIIQALDSRTAEKCLTALHVLSIGVHNKNRYIKGDNLNWGITQWSPYLFYILLEGSINMITFECNQLLGKRFHRLQLILNGNFNLDNWQKIPKLIQLAEKEDISETIDWLKKNWL